MAGRRTDSGKEASIDRPPSRLAGLRHFAVELFTVTCGVVIALALGSLVEHGRNATLARQARAEFAAELSESRDRIAGEIRDSKPLLDFLGKMIEASQARLHHKPFSFPDGPASRGFPTLPDTAWSTALATQAISQLSFAEVRALSAVYTRQATLNEVIAHARDQSIGLASYGDISDSAAGELSDDIVRKGVGDALVAYAYARAIADSESRLAQSYTDALQTLASQGAPAMRP